MKFVPGCCNCSTPTTVSGNLVGCTSAGIPGTVAIYNGATLLWSGSTSGSGTFTSASFPLSSTTSLTFVGTPTSPRNTTYTGTRSISPGANSGIHVGNCPPAAGYACAGPTTTSAVCPLAISQNLTYTGGTCFGTVYPNDTLVYQGVVGSTSLWQGSATFTLPPGGASLFVYQFAINNTGTIALGAMAVSGPFHGNIFLCNPLLTSCVPFSCNCSCAATTTTALITD